MGRPQLYVRSPAAVRELIIDSLTAINPELPNLVINAGFLTDPGYLAVSPGVVADPR
jgi:hypothetical protein